MDDTFLTPVEIAQRHQVSQSTVYRWVKERRIRTSGEGRQLRVSEADVVDAMGSRSARVPHRADPPPLAAPAMVAVATVTPVSANTWRGVTSAPVVFTYQAEGAVAPDNTPALAQPTIALYTGRSFIPYSIEVAQDYGGGGFEAEFGAAMA